MASYRTGRSELPGGREEWTGRACRSGKRRPSEGKAKTGPWASGRPVRLGQGVEAGQRGEARRGKCTEEAAEPGPCGLEPGQAFWETHSSLPGGRQGPSVLPKAAPSPPGRPFRPMVLGLPLPFEGQRNPCCWRPRQPFAHRAFSSGRPPPGHWHAAGVSLAAQMTPRRARSQPPSHSQSRLSFPRRSLLASFTHGGLSERLWEGRVQPEGVGEFPRLLLKLPVFWMANSQCILFYF